MLSTQTRLRLQNILQRLAAGKTVSLKERIELQKYSDHDPTVAAWLRRARRQQRKEREKHAGDPLLSALDLDPSEPHSEYCPDQDDLGDWFQGAPYWLRRS
ncbi:hypothetical protein [Synechococcus sp. MIT S1220]|uniref:hypothetical protein n=1 Tax=Synechococcus sp. MIT S1220 TaxID=3082549 RepID=UPI0039B0BD8A